MKKFVYYLVALSAVVACSREKETEKPVSEFEKDLVVLSQTDFSKIIGTKSGEEVSVAATFDALIEVAAPVAEKYGVKAKVSESNFYKDTEKYESLDPMEFDPFDLMMDNCTEEFQNIIIAELNNVGHMSVSNIAQNDALLENEKIALTILSSITQLTPLEGRVTEDECEAKMQQQVSVCNILMYAGYGIGIACAYAGAPYASPIFGALFGVAHLKCKDAAASQYRACMREAKKDK